MPLPRNARSLRVLTGFTLAEVLITLGIIGVVAAMTMPSIIHKIEKIVLKNQIKRNYSMHYQNYIKIRAELGDTLDVLNGFGYQEFNDAFIKNLRIVKICKKNALANKCIKEYEGLNIAQCSAFNEFNIYNTQTVYILNDGSFLIPYNGDWRSLWAIDVNGKKGPNKAGYDLFEIVVDDDKQMIYRGNGCFRTAQGGLKNFNDIEKW